MPVIFAPFFVAPLAGAWIEMLFLPELRRRKRSLPSRERGLKLNIIIMVLEEDVVAPLAGAWIEIVVFPSMEVCVKVAPLAGAWIEMICFFQTAP